MLQLVGFWNWYPPILVMIEDLLSYLDMISIISANSQIARSYWKFGTNTLVVLLFWVQTSIRLSFNHWCYVHVFFVLQMVHNHKRVHNHRKCTTHICLVKRQWHDWITKQKIKLKQRLEEKSYLLTSLKLHVLWRRPHQRIKNDHHIFHKR
jgi:hypothetical protein